VIKTFITKLIRGTFFRLYRTLGRLYLAPMLLLEWKRQPYDSINERSIEYGFALKWLSRICPAEVFDVGPGQSAWPQIMAKCGFRVTAIDKVTGYWKSGYFNRHFYVMNDDITNPKTTKQFDFITCISVLEHIPNHQDAVSGMFKLLKPGGHLLLTIPYNEKQYIGNVYKLPGAGYGQNFPHICQVYSRKEIDAWLRENQGEIIEQEYYRIFSGDFWTFGKRIYPPGKIKNREKCHLTCLLIQNKTE